MALFERFALGNVKNIINYSILFNCLFSDLH